MKINNVIYGTLTIQFTKLSITNRFKKEKKRKKHHIAKFLRCLAQVTNNSFLNTHFSEKLHDSDTMKSEALSVLMKVCHGANFSVHGHPPSLEEAMAIVKGHSCYSANVSTGHSAEGHHRLMYNYAVSI